MSVPESRHAKSIAPLVPDHMRSILNGPASGPSEQDLERLARRMAPLVGLPFADLIPVSTPQGAAPANPAPAVSGAGGAGFKGGLGKLASSAAFKTVASLCALGAGLWWVTPSRQPARSVAVPAPVQAPAGPAPIQDVGEPHAPAQAEAIEAAAEDTKPALIKARKREPKVAQLPAAAPDELTLIKEAQALRGQGPAMLSALAEHARFYPNGMLAQEREVLAIEALVSLGRTREASARAARLESQFPNSAHLTRVRALLQKSEEQ